MTHTKTFVAFSLGLFFLIGGCPGSGGEETEPPQDVTMFVSGLLPTGPVQEGWTISLTRAEIALSQPTFYGNSTHESVVAHWFEVSKAYAHAGHAHGEADAETSLADTYIVDLLAPEAQQLGVLSMAPALYFDGKLRLEKAIDGHTLVLEGVATDPDGVDHPLEVIVDVEGWVAGLELDLLVGAESSAPQLPLIVRLDALFDAIDLEALSAEGSELRLGPDSGDAYLVVKAAMQDPTLYVQEKLLH